jgi:hypothetical protein
MYSSRFRHHDEFRMYVHRKPIHVGDQGVLHHLYFNDPLPWIESKLMKYPTFIPGSTWFIAQEDFDLFIKITNIHYQTLH